MTTSTSLVNQLSSNATGAAASQRANSANNASSSNAVQFSTMLSSEMVQRNAATADPAPAQPAAQSTSQTQNQAQTQAAKQTNEADNDDAQADAAAKTADSKTASTDAAKDSDKTDDADAKDDDATATTDPAAAMLALMASLKHAGQAGATSKSTTTKAFDTLNGGKGKGTDAAQLSALQSALKSTAKDTGTDAAAGVQAATLGDAAADAAATAKAGTADTTFSAALTAAKTEGKVELDTTSDLGLQQARDAANLAAQVDPTAIAQAQQAQPTGFDAVQAAVAGDTLSADVGTDAWNDQVGQKIVYMAGSDDQTAEMTLNPPDLGPLQIVLSVSNDQANVTFSSNHEEVRQALEDALPRLREMMNQSGIALGNATVNAGTGGNGQAQDQSSGSSSRGRRSSGSDSDTADTTVRTVTRTIATGTLGTVDTFA